MVAKVVEGEASHMLNMSKGEGVDGGGAFQTQFMDLSGVARVLYACEGVYHVTLPHPPVRPASLVRPMSLACPMHCQLPLLHL